MRAHRTIAGDMIDVVAHRLMGSDAHAASLLEANRHVAGLGPVLPAGLVLAIPDAPAAPGVRQPIRLWSAS